MRRTLLALLCVGLLLAQPASVAASAYSPVTSRFTWIPPGYTSTAMCDQSGILDTAVNYNQALSRTTTACSYIKNLPAGYLGSEVGGWRDGSFCGVSGVYYSTSTTSGWQLWATMCSDPSGLQEFWTTGWAYGWNGSDYNLSAGLTSPHQNY